MKIKIVTIYVCMLLISCTTTLAFIPFSRDEQQTKNQFFDTTPVPLLLSKRWMKTFGGTENDVGFSVQQTSDGGYIITGRTSDYYTDYSDVLLIRTDSNGNKIWDKTFGATNYDCGMSVQQTTDGGYIIAGFSESDSTGCGDVLLIKTDDNGNKIWDKSLGGTWDEGDSVQQTMDGGYIITGCMESSGNHEGDVLLIKTDSNGDMVWNKTFGGTYWDGGDSVQQTMDGGYIIVGYAYFSFWADGDVWLIKTDGNGNKIWDKTFGATNYDCGMSVQQTTDGGYIITGVKGVFGAGSGDVLLIKTDGNGDKVWDRTFGGTNEDWGWSVQQTTDGGYIITGYTLSFGAGNEDVWLIKTDNTGNEIWNKTFGGTGSDRGTSVQQTTDRGYIVVGTTTSFGAGNEDVWLIKTDSQGKSKTTSLDNLWFERLFQ